LGAIEHVVGRYLHEPGCAAATARGEHRRPAGVGALRGVRLFFGIVHPRETRRIDEHIGPEIM
jgi:hypothetical protein